MRGRELPDPALHLFEAISARRRKLVGEMQVVEYPYFKAEDLRWCRTIRHLAKQPCQAFDQRRICVQTEATAAALDRSHQPNARYTPLYPVGLGFLLLAQRGNLAGAIDHPRETFLLVLNE